MYVMNGIGQAQQFCPSANAGCFSSAQERDTVRTQCQAGYLPTPMPGGCPPDGVVRADDTTRFRPCEIAHLELCGAEQDPSGQIAMMTAQQAFGPSAAEEAGSEGDKSKDNTMIYVLGGVGILAVGGISYFLSKKKRR